MSFAVALPPAIAGMLLRPGRRFDAPLLGMIATHLAAMLLFMPLARFRAPLVPLLLVPAAFGVLRVIDRFAARRPRPAVAGLVAAVLVAALVGRPAAPGAADVRPSDRAATLQARITSYNVCYTKLLRCSASGRSTAPAARITSTWIP